MTDLRIKELLKEKGQDQPIVVEGWVRTKRESKAFSFVELNDGSCMKNLQVIINETIPDYHNFISRVNTGASLRVEGKLVASPGQGQSVEVQAEKIEVLGE
ncbi:MAG: OB-fold nucleic acid binding domain-containing protein, partial [Spirochaetes bacterium]|nr:OB-fold nucleic acid binding domain-containing protein [Spirochaetota bacterium]